ncbi:MAG: histidine phosphatase family protein [Pseudomonadota bacterium]
MTAQETRWWWIRHAPVIQTENKIYGQTDLPADTTDDTLFGALAQALPRDAVLITSDLQRAMQTAAAIADAGLPMPDGVRDPAFREQHFGDWQGEMRDAFHARRARPEPTFWMAAIDERPPNGESFVDLVERVIPAVERHTDTHGGRDIVCVAHGGTIKAALAHALELDHDQAITFSVANCSVTRLDHIRRTDGSEAWRVAMVNWLPHR